MTELLITLSGQNYHARLNNSPTVEKLINALPVEGKANIWGEEIYFEVPVSTAPERDAQEEVDVGTIAYWPSGRAFCIFFGPTPVSTGENPRAYSPVNILGKIEGEVSGLKKVKQGDVVRLQMDKA